MKLTASLRLCGSTLALLAAGILSDNVAMAQSAPTPAAASNDDSSIETVTVTGTNIRGTTPIGSNLMTITPADIKATGATDVQGFLANDPALMGMGQAGQGQSNGAVYQPSIHSLGNSGASSTLVIIDGHRMPTGGSGTNHTEPDPNLLPINIIERVEVLAEGASSIYGSDAIAGVVNFITRKSYSGIELTGSSGFADGKTDLQGGVLAGTQWSGGNVIFAYSYTHQGMLKDTSRPWTNPNQIARGVASFNNFNCSPASIQMAGLSTIYTSPTATSPIANTAVNSPCNQWAYGALVPSTTRNNVMIKGSQDFGNFTLSTDLLYASRRDRAITSRGTLTATAFGSGPQANPFYKTPSGYTGTATSETIRWDADQLLGPGAYALNGADTMYGDANMEYRLGDNFVFDLLELFGRDDSTSNTLGQVNPSSATLALNGTVNTGGTTNTPIPNTNIFYTQLPLTNANALDVWNPASSNGTSPAVIASMLDNNNLTRMVTSVNQLRLSTNGTVAELPAGPLKVAFGGENVDFTMYQNLQQPNGSGPSRAGGSIQFWNFTRQVYSFFGEANIPIISPTMDIPGVEKLTFDISGRYDDYSDFGVTANPKFGFDWQVIDDLKLRGNYATSFVAPPLDEVGDVNGNSIISSVVPFTNNVNVPTSLFPQVTQFGVPCNATSGTCNINSLQGLHVTTGDHQMQPDKGRTWSFGGDYSPSFLPGFTASATMWYAHMKGAAQGPQIGFIINNSSLSKLVTFYPAAGGATQAQINAIAGGILATSAIPNVVQYIVDTKNSSIVNLQEQGVDLSASYAFDTDDWGSFHVSDAASIILNAHECLGFYGTCAPNQTFSITNTVGANGTFSTVAQQMRADVGWAMDPFNVDIFWNFTGAYHNWGAGAVHPLVTNAVGNIIGGGDHVNAYSTADIHIAYDFNTGMLGEDELSLTVRDLFNSTPPVFNTSTGYDNEVANPIGRMVTIGLTTKF